MNPSIPIACAFALVACEQAEVEETESAESTLQVVDARPVDEPLDEAAQCEEPSPASFWPSGSHAGTDESGPERTTRTSLARDAPSASGTDRSITLADVEILRGSVDPGSAVVGAVGWRSAIATPREDTPRAVAE